MAQEIERKFLVEGDFKSQSYSNSHIAQGYICSSPGRTVRIRIRGDKGYITIKGDRSQSGISCFEWEKEISLNDAKDLLELCLPGKIDKTRYLVNSGNHTFEVDEFHGENEGLVMAEVELDAEDELFDKPSFIGEEVTGDHRYYNSHLSRFPFKDWKNPKE